MSLSLCIDSQDWLGADCVSIGDTGGGVLGSAIPATGDAGSGYAYPMLEAGDMGKEVCGRLVSVPVGLTLYAYEDTSSIASANDGTYTAYYQPYLDYAPFGTPLPIVYTFGAPAGVTAAASWTEGAETFAMAGTVAAPAGVTATAAWTEGSETFAAVGTVEAAPVTATAAWTEGSELFAAVGTVGAGAVSGAAAWTEGAEVFAMAIEVQTFYARAPSGDGYRPQRITNTTRPAAIQRNER